ncbi:hypothetical protein MASR2M15_06470 [Anaerolineales bacterium]
MSAHIPLTSIPSVGADLRVRPPQTQFGAIKKFFGLTFLLKKGNKSPFYNLEGLDPAPRPYRGGKPYASARKKIPLLRKKD